jgi:hypothetical protein
MNGPPNVDGRLGDATIIALKAIFVAWSRPEKLIVGFFRANQLAVSPSELSPATP